MTTSDWKKMLKQLEVKPEKLNKFLKHNKPKDRKFGKITKKCRRCGTMKGNIARFGLNLCRRCFREVATDIGFKKYS